MAKRETVIVDEDYLKDMIAGDVPRIRRARAGIDEIQETQKQEAVPTPTQENTVDRIIPETKENYIYTGYTDTYLISRNIGPRRQAYISAEIYNKINRFLPVISDGLSITKYIDNILLSHLEQYKDEINALYESKSHKPL
jgi:hypothetical protein